MACKILIVDSDDDFTVALEHQLVDNGFVVSRVPDGMLGMQYALRHKPDLIIADLQCPAGGGVSMLTNLRRSILTRHIPVLITAGPGHAESKKKLLEFRMLTFIQKPFLHEELLARIQQSLAPHSKVVTTGDYVPTPPSPSPSPDPTSAPFAPDTIDS